MATLTLTVPGSTSDATVDEFEGGYNDSQTFHFWGQPGASPPANYGVGIRVLVTLTGADTINEVSIKLMKDSTEWPNCPWRLAAINEDNTAVFSSGSPPGSRAIVTASIAAESVNANHVDGTVYTFPTTAPLRATLAAACAAVFDRGGWASGNALGIVCQSDQDASATLGYGRETYHTWDSSVASSEPQVVIDYTAGAGPSTTLPVRRRAPMRVWPRARYA